MEWWDRSHASQIPTASFSLPSLWHRLQPSTLHLTQQNGIRPAPERAPATALPILAELTSLTLLADTAPCTLFCWCWCAMFGGEQLLQAKGQEGVVRHVVI